MNRLRKELKSTRPGWGKVNYLTQAYYGSGPADPVPGALLHYLLDYTDVNLTRVGADDKRSGPASLDAAGSGFSNADNEHFTGAPDSGTLGTISTGAFSVSFWYKTENSGSRVVIQNGSTVVTNGAFSVQVGQNISISARTGGSQYSVGTFLSNTNDGTWHFLTFTSTGSGGTALIYDNGVVIKTSTLTYDITDTGQVNIGKAVGGQEFDGVLDDIRVYDKVLTPGEITSLYNNTNNWTPAQLNNIAAWYDASNPANYSETAGQVTQWDDISGNGLHLTQATGSNQPITGTRTIKGLNAFDFDGANHYLVNPDGVQEDTLSFFILAQTDNDAASTDGTQAVLSQTIGSNPTTEIHMKANEDVGKIIMRGASSINQSFTVTRETPQVMTAIAEASDGTDGVLRVSGGSDVAVDGVYPLSTAIRDLIIGRQKLATPTRSFNGLLGEIIIVSGQVSDAVRDQIEAYLMWKWGGVPNFDAGHAYKNFPPKV